MFFSGSVMFLGYGQAIFCFLKRCRTVLLLNLKYKSLGIYDKVCFRSMEKLKHQRTGKRKPLILWNYVVNVSFLKYIQQQKNKGKKGQSKGAIQVPKNCYMVIPIFLMSWWPLGIVNLNELLLCDSLLIILTLGLRVSLDHWP